MLRALTAAALLAPAVAFSQTTTTTTTNVLGVAPSIEVLRLAPQLVSFAGSQANFDNLVNGLALGTAVTITTLLPNGQTQIVSFTPAATMTPTQIAQTLEAARQSLISRGIATPTAQQVAVSLAGGTLPTATGNVQVNALLPNDVVPVAPAPAASTSATASATGGTVPPPTGVTTTTAAPTNGLASPAAQTQNGVTTTTTPNTPSPAALVQGQTGTGTPPSPAATLQQRRGSNVSDSPTLSNISNTPSPTAAGGTSTSTTTTTGGTTATTTSPTPITPAQVAPNGSPFAPVQR